MKSISYYFKFHYKTLRLHSKHIDEQSYFCLHSVTVHFWKQVNSDYKTCPEYISAFPNSGFGFGVYVLCQLRLLGTHEETNCIELQFIVNNIFVVMRLYIRFRKSRITERHENTEFQVMVSDYWLLMYRFDKTKTRSNNKILKS